MAVNLKIVSQVVASGTPGPAGKSAYQIAVDNGFQGTESEWLKELHPFKGWFDSVSDLETSHANPIVGDYAYVKGATSSDPVKIYKCSTEGTWSDSGRTVDTSSVQTFGSGEAVNDVDITDDSSEIVEDGEKIPTAGAVAGALGNAEFSTGEKVKNVGIDDEPTAGSDNLVKSGGTMQKISTLYNKLIDLFINDTSCMKTSEDGLFITDEQGNAAINLLDIGTYSPIEIKDIGDNSLVICDEQRNVYIDFSKGIKTKTWDGNYLYPSNNINRGTTDLTGCMNKAFDMIHTKWPTAQVFVCSIMKMGRTMANATWSYLKHNANDLTYNQYNKRIKDCAELAGFTFIDLWGEMSIDPMNATQAPIYFHNAQEIADRGVDPNRINDRLHPIQAGHERIAKIIYNHIVNANGGDTWQGKKAIFFGDSITDNKDGQHTDKVYYSYLTDWLQLKDDGMNPNGYSTKNTVHYPQNAGAYGTGYMLEWEGQGNLYERIPNYNNDYDLVVIMLGVNDFQEPLGEIYNY